MPTTIIGPGRTSSGDALDDDVRQILGRHPAVGLAVGIVHNGRLERFFGHGVADIESQTPITKDTVFRIASITKTFTAIAVMQLVERGLIDLDAPANHHLRAFRLEPVDERWRPATVRHLLTHTAGLPELAHIAGVFKPDFGESVPVGRPIPSLAEFYRGRVVVGAEPGTRFVYGNQSPATLGQIVEDVTGVSLADYVREHIFEPLGMVGSELVRSDSVTRRLATGYEIASRGVERIEERDMITTGAASGFASPADMARYLVALLGGGSNEHGSILRPETLATMFEPQYRPDPRIPGMGMGFFRHEVRGHRVVGHQGTHPGFHSQILVAPDDGVAVMAFTNGASQADFWLPGELEGLLRRLLGADLAGSSADVPQRPDTWADLCGWYRLSARSTDVRLRGMMGLGAEVFVRDGELTFRFLSPVPDLFRGYALLPADPHDPYVYRIDLEQDGLEPMTVAFGQDSVGSTSRLALDVMPLVLDKQPESTNPKRRAMRAAAVTGAGAAVAGLGLRALRACGSRGDGGCC